MPPTKFYTGLPHTKFKKNMKNISHRNVSHIVQEKFERNFRVNREMRDEILVYDPFLTKFSAKMVSKCKVNAGKIWILGFRV
jgi:hypothetical protein